MLHEIVLLLLAAPLLIVAGYLLLLTLMSGKPEVRQAAIPQLRFTVIVPAHNEAAGIACTVQSLLAMDYPAELCQVWVVADNCTDDTAGLARAAGAHVLQRHSETERGKGYALQWGYEAVLRDGWADAVVVVDADSIASANLLRAFASRIGAGALAAQSFYGVRNPLAAWRTRLMTIALAIFHRLRGRGREALGVSAVLHGNGMCFSIETLRRVPHRAFSIVEDLEYSIALGRAGVRVWYVDEAEVLGEMVTGEQAARSQRWRWEGGRRQMLNQHGWPLLRDAVKDGNSVLFDLAMEVLIPPLAYLGLAVVLLALAGVGLLLTGLLHPWAVAVAITPLLMLLLHVVRGVALSGLGWQGWLAIARAPLYLAWKLALLSRHRAGGAEWVRTSRENPRKPP